MLLNHLKRILCRQAMTIAVSAACIVHVSSVRAESITTSDAPVTTLADGRSGVFAFASVTPRNAADLLDHPADHPALITASLSLPANTSVAVPAVVIVHGSSGVTPGDRVWAQRLNALGYASLVVDSFSGRGIKNTEADQTQLSMTADIADAYAALRLLATHPGIDRNRIAVMGFSRGGIAALYSLLEPFRHALIADDLHFAAHVAFYPACGTPYTSAHMDGAPVLMLLGGKDDYTPAAPCMAYADDLRAHGQPVTTVVYPDAYHAFDRAIRIRVLHQATSARDCHGAYDLDARRLMMYDGEQKLSGPAAVAQTKNCLRRGVTLGGDALGQERAPGEVSAFLKTVFALVQQDDETKK